MPWTWDKTPERVRRWAPEFEAAEKAFGTDAYVLAAICDRESLGGAMLQPKGPTGVGDRGRGHGLMQIDVSYHPTFLSASGPDGRPMWQSPTWNILYGAALLAANLTALGGNYPAAIASYNASIGRVLKVLQLGKEGNDLVAALDHLTTGGNYVSDVLTRARLYGSKI